MEHPIFIKITTRKDLLGENTAPFILLPLPDQAMAEVRYDHRGKATLYVALIEDGFSKPLAKFPVFDKVEFLQDGKTLTSFFAMALVGENQGLCAVHVTEGSIVKPGDCFKVQLTPAQQAVINQAKSPVEGEFAIRSKATADIMPLYQPEYAKSLLPEVDPIKRISLEDLYCRAFYSESKKALITSELMTYFKSIFVEKVGVTPLCSSFVQVLAELVYYHQVSPITPRISGGVDYMPGLHAGWMLPLDHSVISTFSDVVTMLTVDSVPMALTCDRSTLRLIPGKPVYESGLRVAQELQAFKAALRGPALELRFFTDAVDALLLGVRTVYKPYRLPEPPAIFKEFKDLCWRLTEKDILLVHGFGVDDRNIISFSFINKE